MKTVTNFLLIFLFLINGATALAQEGKSATEDLNKYKYVVIPMKFSFQDKENEYLINSRLKHLLNQHSFNTLVEKEDFPDDLEVDRCLALYADLESVSEGFFSMKTELKLILKNCRNDEVFVTELGESRAKDYEQGYKEALEDAMTSFNAVNYEYNGNEGVEKEKSASNSDEDYNLLSDLQGNNYKKGETVYEISKIKAGYLMVEAETGDREALMNLTEDETILFNGKSMSGTASVNDQGDIIVEYFDDEKGEMKKVTYKQE